MAQFRGVVQSARGEVTRNGNKNSGLTVIAASWEGCIKTTLYHDQTTGKDMALVEFNEWYGAGSSKVIYRGSVSGE